MELLTDDEKKALEICRRFAAAPFPFPNATLMLLVVKLAEALEKSHAALHLPL